MVGLCIRNALIGLAALLGSCAMPAGPQSLAQMCPADDPRIAGQWFQAPAAFEHGDSSRTHLFRTIERPSARDLGKGTPVELDTLEGQPGVYNFAVRAPGEVYVLGGATSGGLGEVPPYVARIDMHRGVEIWRTELPDQALGRAGENPWTYPGVIAVHANGDIYTVQGNVLSRLNPETGALTAKLELPVRGQAGDSAYNGFAAFPDGQLVLKSHHRPGGCGVDGFRAFLRCGTDGASASVLAVVDPDAMQLLARANAPELIGGRITVTRHGDRVFVYAPGLDSLHRFEWADGELSYDKDWGPVRYRAGRETPATAAAVLGDFVIVQSNALPTDAPSRLTAISQSDPGKRFEIQPFADRPRSMIPSMPSVDPDLGLVFATDGLAGGLAALRLDPQTGFDVAWRADQGSLSFSALIGPPDGRILISSDIADGYRVDYEREAMVWRRAADGVELARSAPFARLGGTVLAPDCGGIVYAASSRASQIHRLQLRPQTR